MWWARHRGNRAAGPVWFGVAMVVVAAMALSGCGRRIAPAPLDDRSSLFFGRGTAVPVARPATERPPASAAAPIFTTGGSASVQPGDTLYGLSRRHNVPIRAIINANSLAPPYTLQVGQTLTLPRQAYHRVAAGDTVSSIARAYRVSTQDLVRLNAIEPPYLIYVGQPVLLPTAGDASVAARPADPGAVLRGAAMPSEPQATQPLPPGSSVTTSVSPNATGTLQPSDRAPAIVGDNPPPEALASLPPPETPLPELPITAPTGAFIWPVQGSVISGYGAKPGGLFNDGINIAVPTGTPVRAAQDGEVAYAGNELRGYGNLLLVRHANGWMTAYAHNESLLVGRGDKVRRGQVIARSGASGSVGEPQLHFEMRQGTRAVDPVRYLAGQGISLLR